MKSKRDYADIKKKEKTQKVEDKQNKHVNRRMKKQKTQMYQKYTRLREGTYTDKGKHNNCVYKHKRREKDYIDNSRSKLI